MELVRSGGTDGFNPIGAGRATTARPAQENLVLASLPEPVRQEIAPSFTHVDLAERACLEMIGKPNEHCHFLTSGIASCTITNRQGQSAEVALIGHEGVSGLSAIVGGTTPLTSTTMQGRGTSLRIPVRTLLDLSAQHSALSFALRLSFMEFSQQVAFSVLSASRYRIHERLARRLLMMADRIGPSGMPITQQTLASMLGVRRAGVTDALGRLQDRAYISVGRGVISVIDRDGLVAAANGCYQT